MNKILFSALALALTTTGLTASLEAKPAARTAARDWTKTITLTAERNAVMGNPAAPIKVVEYLSFACSHCAEFVAQSKPRLEGDLVRRGLVSIERRPVVMQNQPFALVAALAVQCGPTARWFANGDAMLAAQPKWLPKLGDPALQKKWNGTPANRYAMTMARDLGFYELMQGRGYTTAQINACLTNKLNFDAILKTSNYAFNTIGISGTPTFLVNDSVVSFYDWPNLEALIETMLPQ